MTDLATESTALHDRSAAEDVILRYAASIDDQDFETYRTCFVPEVELHGFGAEVVHGIDSWMDFVQGPRALQGDPAHARASARGGPRGRGVAPRRRAGAALPAQPKGAHLHSLGNLSLAARAWGRRVADRTTRAGNAGDPLERSVSSLRRRARAKTQARLPPR